MNVVLVRVIVAVVASWPSSRCRRHHIVLRLSPPLLWVSGVVVGVVASLRLSSCCRHCRCAVIALLSPAIAGRRQSSSRRRGHRFIVVTSLRSSLRLLLQHLLCPCSCCWGLRSSSSPSSSSPSCFCHFHPRHRRSRCASFCGSGVPQ